MKVISDPILSMPSQVKANPQHRNLFGSALTGVTSALGNLIPEGSCFGSESCQENRAAQTAAQSTAAQAQLLQAQTQATATANQTKIIIIVVLAILAIAGIGAFVYLKKKG